MRKTLNQRLYLVRNHIRTFSRYSAVAYKIDIRFANASKYKTENASRNLKYMFEQIF